LVTLLRFIEFSDRLETVGNPCAPSSGTLGIDAMRGEGHIMSLVLKPSSSEDTYDVLHGELQVGQIYKRKVALRPESQWVWALNGVPQGPAGLPFTGLAATLDEAAAALKERWAEWLASAKLSESGGEAP
jgi:hypothetical protein